MEIWEAEIPAEAASPLAGEIQWLEIPWDWIRIDMEPVTEKMLSGSCDAHCKHPLSHLYSEDSPLTSFVPHSHNFNGEIKA